MDVAKVEQQYMEGADEGSTMRIVVLSRLGEYKRGYMILIRPFSKRAAGQRVVYMNSHYMHITTRRRARGETVIHCAVLYSADFGLHYLN